jgi:hypothetical protein
MQKQLVIGFGTGRSGTTSLSAFLNAQDNIRVMHEGRMKSSVPATTFAWMGDELNVLQWINALVSTHDRNHWVGDIGMYFINYIERIIQEFPNARFICMERPHEEVVGSYLKWTEGKNHWMDHDGTQWKHVPKWDKAYPKYIANTKEQAIHQYCVDYGIQARALREKYPAHVMIVNLYDFNERPVRESILDFIHYTGIRRTEAEFICNPIEHLGKERLSTRLIRALVNFKRKLIGRPGHRFGRSKNHPAK